MYQLPRAKKKYLNHHNSPKTESFFGSSVGIVFLQGIISSFDMAPQMVLAGCVVFPKIRITFFSIMFLRISYRVVFAKSLRFSGTLKTLTNFGWSYFLLTAKTGHLCGSFVLLLLGRLEGAQQICYWRKFSFNIPLTVFSKLEYFCSSENPYQCPRTMKRWRSGIRMSKWNFDMLEAHVVASWEMKVWNAHVNQDFSLHQLPASLCATTGLIWLPCTCKLPVSRDIIFSVGQAQILPRKKQSR